MAFDNKHKHSKRKNSFAKTVVAKVKATAIAEIDAYRKKRSDLSKLLEELGVAKSILKRPHTFQIVAKSPILFDKAGKVVDKFQTAYAKAEDIAFTLVCTRVAYSELCGKYNA